MQLIDTHCHLDFPCFQPLADKLFHWQQQGISRFVVPAVGPSNWESVLALGKIPNIHIALGIHPCFMPSGDVMAAADALGMLLDQHRSQIVAVGECGLDRRFVSHMPWQRQLLIRQLDYAHQYELPVILHCVRMYDELYSLLKQHSVPHGGIVHAFQGSLLQAQRFYQLGFKLGIGGAVSWPSAHKLRALLTQLPLDSFVLETDAPDMPLYHGLKGENTPDSIFSIFQIVQREIALDEEYLSEIFQSNSEKVLSL
ncbi:TatD family hydrolase [Celerinatantimonas sp. YJH-8]|uniref:TatD family hydrolase n=1 Tax=Celerinatantimonas sp. YJH-8 TaxID=3228714 RepID=UPI0038C93D43